MCLENNGKMDFQPYKVPGTLYGRWLTMDAGDVDADGKTDIIPGNFSIAPSVIKLTGKWKESPLFIVLKNITHK